MSEPKKVALNTLAPLKKDKKNSVTQKVHRFNLSLSESTKDVYPEFNYNDLLGNSLKKNGSVVSEDPFEDEQDDESALREIARKFEEKYGPRGGRKTLKKLDDYVELGKGYDETDPFIDNTDLAEDLMPEDLMTARGGFYINGGILELEKRPPERPTNNHFESHRRKKVRIVSDSEEESSDSRSSETQQKRKSDDELDNNWPKRQRVDNDSASSSRDERSTSYQSDPPYKDTMAEAIESVVTKAREEAEKDLARERKIKERLSNHKTSKLEDKNHVTDDRNHKGQEKSNKYEDRGHKHEDKSHKHEDRNHKHEDRVHKHEDRSHKHEDRSHKHDEKSHKHEEKSHKHHDDKRNKHEDRSHKHEDKSRNHEDRSHKHKNEDKSYKNEDRSHRQEEKIHNKHDDTHDSHRGQEEDHQKNDEKSSSDDNDADNVSSDSSSSDSRSSSSRGSASDEPKQDEKKEELPPEVQSWITQIKSAAMLAREMENKTFTPSINKMFCKLESKLGTNEENRKKTYEQLAETFKCSDVELMSKMQSMVEETNKLKAHIDKLKEAVKSQMPSMVEKHNSLCNAAAQQRNVVGSESDNDDDDPGKKTQRKPRRKFDFTEEITDLLCEIVKVKMGSWENQSKKQPLEEYLKAYLDEEIKPIWPRNWMNCRLLFKETKVVHGYITQKRRYGAPVGKKHPSLSPAGSIPGALNTSPPMGSSPQAEKANIGMGRERSSSMSFKEKSVISSLVDDKPNPLSLFQMELPSTTSLLKEKQQPLMSFNTMRESDSFNPHSLSNRNKMDSMTNDMVASGREKALSMLTSSLPQLGRDLGVRGDDFFKQQDMPRTPLSPPGLETIRSSGNPSCSATGDRSKYSYIKPEDNSDVRYGARTSTDRGAGGGLGATDLSPQSHSEVPGLSQLNLYSEIASLPEDRGSSCQNNGSGGSTKLSSPSDMTIHGRQGSSVVHSPPSNARTPKTSISPSDPMHSKVQSGGVVNKSCSRTSPHTVAVSSPSLNVHSNDKYNSVIHNRGSVLTSTVYSCTGSSKASNMNPVYSQAYSSGSLNPFSSANSDSLDLINSSFLNNPFQSIHGSSNLPPPPGRARHSPPTSSYSPYHHYSQSISPSDRRQPPMAHAKVPKPPSPFTTQAGPPLPSQRYQPSPHPPPPISSPGSVNLHQSVYDSHGMQQANYEKFLQQYQLNQSNYRGQHGSHY